MIKHRAVGLVLHPAAAGQLRRLQQPVLAAWSTCRRSWRRLRLAGGARDVGEKASNGVAVQILGERLADGGLVLLPSCVAAPAAAAYATRHRGYARWRRCCAAGRRSPPRHSGLGPRGLVSSVQSIRWSSLSFLTECARAHLRRLTLVITAILTIRLGERSGRIRPSGVSSGLDGGRRSC